VLLREDVSPEGSRGLNRENTTREDLRDVWFCRGRRHGTSSCAWLLTRPVASGRSRPHEGACGLSWIDGSSSSSVLWTVWTSGLLAGQTPSAGVDRAVHVVRDDDTVRWTTES